MDARCLIQMDGRDYRMEIECLKKEAYRKYSPHVHSHPSYHLILVSKGENLVEISGEEAFSAKEGALLFINPLVPHRFSIPSGGMVEHTSLIWRFRADDGSYALSPLQSLSGRASKPSPFICKELSKSEASLFASAHRQALEAVAGAGSFPLSMLAFELFFIGFRTLMGDAAPIPASPKERMAERAKAIVEREMVSPLLDIPSIASELGLHPNYLSAAFKAQEGVTLNSYVRDRRIELAKSIMKADPERPLAEVAALCGFSRHSYFARTFRKLCGATPKSFRDRDAV